MSFLFSECFVSGPGANNPTARFALSNVEVSFEEGRRTCLGLEDGDLASIHSEEENEIAVDLFFSSGDVERGPFIGLFDEFFDNATEVLSTERFAWVDGSEFNFGTEVGDGVSPPWKFEEPNNFGELQEDCVILRDLTGEWDDRECELDGLRRFMCRTACEEEEEENSLVLIGASAGAALLAFSLLLAIFVVRRKKKKRDSTFYLDGNKGEKKLSGIQLFSQRAPTDDDREPAFSLDPPLQNPVVRIPSSKLTGPRGPGFRVAPSGTNQGQTEAKPAFRVSF